MTHEQADAVRGLGLEGTPAPTIATRLGLPVDDVRKLLTEAAVTAFTTGERVAAGASADSIRAAMAHGAAWVAGCALRLAGADVPQLRNFTEAEVATLFPRLRTALASTERCFAATTPTAAVAAAPEAQASLRELGDVVRLLAERRR